MFTNICCKTTTSPAFLSAFVGKHSITANNFAQSNADWKNSSKDLTNDTLFRWGRNDSALVEMLFHQLFVKTKKVAETSVDFHFGFPEVWNVRLENCQHTVSVMSPFINHHSTQLRGRGSSPHQDRNLC